MHPSSIPKFLLSFLKREWSFDDYPVHAREQNPLGRGDVPRWVAGIDGLYLTGLGETRSEAIQDLRASFARYSQDRSPPRPGTQAELEFSDCSNVDRLGKTIYDYVESATGVRPFFLSDESSFGDFSTVCSFDDVVAYTLKEHGLDISDREIEPIWMIVDSINGRKAGS